HNHRFESKYKASWLNLAEELSQLGHRPDELVKKVAEFQVAIPSWALGTGGTRFGRFPAGGEPRSLEEKIADVGLIHALNRSSNRISLHIPWDIPQDVAALKDLLKSHELIIDSVNSNTFQDQKDQPYSSSSDLYVIPRPKYENRPLTIISKWFVLGNNWATNARPLQYG